MCLRSGGSARSFSKKKARAIGIRNVVWFRANRIWWIGGSGESMGKQVLLWAKNFIAGVLGQFIDGWRKKDGST
jgi:hypothetical protein